MCGNATVALIGNSWVTGEVTEDGTLRSVEDCDNGGDALGDRFVNGVEEVVSIMSSGTSSSSCWCANIDTVN